MLWVICVHWLICIFDELSASGLTWYTLAKGLP